MSELTVESNQTEQQRRGRGMLLLLLAMFALPLLIVTAMYQLQWRPGGASNGQLISPPQALKLAEMQTLNGNRFGVTQWKDKWSMVYVSGQRCDATCETQVHDLRQVHVSLNKEIGRVQRILLITSDGKDEHLAEIQKQYPDLVILAGTDVGKLAGQFSPGGEAGTYLVDPLGNLMMRYLPGYAAQGLRKDLMRLLTYSWVG